MTRKNPWLNPKDRASIIRGMKLAWKRRAEKRELDGLFYQCSSCKTEHATWMRRTKTQTWAVCSICGHEKLMARYSASDTYARARSAADGPTRPEGVKP